MKLCIVGDVAFSPYSHAGWLSAGVANVLRSGFGVANLECVLADDDPNTDELVVRGPRWAAASLRDSGIQLVTLANNHTMDLGVEGLRSTIGALDQASIGWVGAGMTETDALAPLVVEREGQRMGFVGRMDASSLQVPLGFAEASRPGVARFNLDETLATGRELRRSMGCGITVCLLHWGIQGVPLLPSWLIASLRRLLDVFDVVAGSHAHVLQPIVRHGGSVAACGMGNLYFAPFDYAGKRLYGGVRLSRLAAVFELDVGRDVPPSIRVHPTVQTTEDETVELLPEPMASIVRALVERCPGDLPVAFGLLWRLKELTGLGGFAWRRRDLLLGNPGRWFGPGAWRKVLASLREPRTR